MQIKNPAAVFDEIRGLMRVHFGVSEAIAFEDQYPEVYKLYVRLRQKLEMSEHEGKE